MHMHKAMMQLAGLFAVARAASTNHRQLSYAPIISYSPGSQVTDHSRAPPPR